MIGYSNIFRNYNGIILFILCFVAITSSACNKNNAECGCNSPTINTITNLKGTLNYYSNNKREISIVVGSPSSLTVFVICDTTNIELQSILRPNRDSVYHVLFSGNVKSFCPCDTLIYLDSRNVIQLTSIIPQ